MIKKGVIMEDFIYSGYYLVKKFEIKLEELTIFIEKILSNHKNERIVAIICLMGPVFLLSTVYTVYTGPKEVLLGYKLESSTWIRECVIDIIMLLESLTTREKGRIIQLVMLLYSIELFAIYIACVFR